MRGVSKWASHAAPLFAVFLVFTAAVWADEPQTLPTDPPQARLNPPSGVTSQARLNPPSGSPTPPEDETAQSRMQPPVGVTSQARINPPVGTPDPTSLLDLILLWLQSSL